VIQSANLLKSGEKLKTISLDLADVARRLFLQFSQIQAMYLFGSRRFRTGSTRSDIDLLIEVTGNIKPSDLRDFATENFPAIDPFILANAEARSCINDSYLNADTKEQLLADLKAVKFWTKSDGQLDADVDWDQKLAHGVSFSTTSLPNLHVAQHALRNLFAQAQNDGLPVRPYIGEAFVEIADFLCDISVRMVQPSSWLGQKGQAKSGWTVALKDEYDFQNLFWTVTKPWLPSLAREQVTITYDNQEKKADFNLSGSKIIIEMKHVKDGNTKAAVVKTLLGLSDFYTQHPNVEAVIFLILIDSNVDVDLEKWEADYSDRSHRPNVITKIVKNVK
jgi:hypothetical protein